MISSAMCEIGVGSIEMVGSGLAIKIAHVLMAHVYHNPDTSWVNN